MEYLIQPWQHQLKAIERAKKLPWFAFLFEMGTGKTSTTINTLRWKALQRQSYLKTLVFCPPIVIPNWKQEFLLHSKLPAKKIVLLDQDGKGRAALFDKHRDEEGTVFVTNYEALLMKGLLERFQNWAADAIVFDESHRLKNYKAARSKLAYELANPLGSKKPLTYILSGTPVLNSPMDLFHQFKVMDNGATFGKNFFVFRARYFLDRNAGMPTQRYFPDWVVAPGAIDEINRLLFQYGMRVTKEECLDLPEETLTEIKVGMTPAQAKNYREMKQDYITFVGENSATATLAITKALRLSQIASGFLPLNPSPEESVEAKVEYPKTPKLEALKELLEEITPHSKVIVWACWRPNYAMIKRVCEELQIECVEVHGSISSGRQKENVERFKTDPKVRVFIGHPGSGGIGINLTCAPYSIFYSLNFSLEHWKQALSRNHRGGQTEKVTHYVLTCGETIDELVYKKLASKEEMSEKLLTTLHEGLRKQAG